MLFYRDPYDWTGWTRYGFGDDPIPGRTYWVRAKQGLGGDDILEGMQVYVGGANWEGGLGLDQVLGWKLIESIPARAAPTKDSGVQAEGVKLPDA